MHHDGGSADNSILFDDKDVIIGFEEANFESRTNKKLMVICHSYNNFQKDSIEGLSDYFMEIEALIRTNPFAEIANILPSTQLERFKKANKIDTLHKPPNINLYSTPLMYLPGDFFYRYIGEKHLRSVKKTIKNHDLSFDLIHSHFTWSAGYVGARLKSEYGVPFVVTAHGYDIYSLPFKDDEWREKIRYVLNTADHIITVSKSNLDYIRKLDISTPTTVIPNGFRSDLFYPRDRSECRTVLKLPLDKKIILTVANLLPIKGLEYLIEAIGIIAKRRTDIRCIIVGSGSQYKTLLRQIQQQDVGKNVHLVGIRPHEEIPLWMGASDIVVLSSLKEGNPTVMFEALGCGRPFIGTRVGGVPEVITSDALGLLVEPANPHDLAENILLALDLKWDYDTILKYAQKFTWKSVTKKHFDIYNKLL